MIKVVALFKKDGSSLEEFRNYYENRDAKLFATMHEMPGVERYTRRYLTPQRDAISASTPPSSFNVVMKVRFSDRERSEADYGMPLDPVFLERSAEDEENLFDHSQMFLHTVDELASETPACLAEVRADAKCAADTAVGAGGLHIDARLPGRTS